MLIAIKQMKNHLIHLALICCLIICFIHNANGQYHSDSDPRIGKFDTLSLPKYLSLFYAPFPSEFNLEKIHNNGNPNTLLSFSFNTQLYNLKLKLPSGEIMSPNIYGWAYSYRKISSNKYWLIYYFEGEVLTRLCLIILDVNMKSLSNPYALSSAGGDDGDWEFSFGRFLNDSTYKFTNFWGDQKTTKDSILGIDRIRPNGEIIQLKRKIFKK